MVFISATKTVESPATARDFGWKLVGADAGLHGAMSVQQQQKAIGLTFQAGLTEIPARLSQFPARDRRSR